MEAESSLRVKSSHRSTSPPGCSFLYRAKLRELWGEHCGSCAYCLCTAKTLVTDFYRDKVEQFCSQECNSKYNKLLCHVSFFLFYPPSSSCQVCQHSLSH